MPDLGDERLRGIVAGGAASDADAVAYAREILAWRAAFRDWSLGKHLGDAKREMKGYQAMVALHDKDA